MNQIVEAVITSIKALALSFPEVVNAPKTNRDSSLLLLGEVAVPGLLHGLRSAMGGGGDVILALVLLS